MRSNYSGTDPSHNPSNGDSTPDYDAWGWDDYWSIDDWMIWFNAMVSAHGIENARSTFQIAWSKQDAFESAYTHVTPAFSKFVVDNGIVLDNYTMLTVHAQNGTQSIGTTVTTVVSNIGDTAQNVTKLLSEIPKVALWGGVILFVVVILIIVNNQKSLVAKI